MFRKIIEPIETGAAAEDATAECRRRMSYLQKLLAAFVALEVVGIVGVKIWPDLFGKIGVGLLGGLAACIVKLSVDWLAERQRLKRLERL